MTTQIWVGAAALDKVSAVINYANVPAPRQLVWFSEASHTIVCAANSSAPENTDSPIAPESDSVAPEIVAAFHSRADLAQVEGGIQAEYRVASLAQIEGRGRILDTLRQCEPHHLIIWLPAPAEAKRVMQAEVPDLTLLNTWVVGVTVVASAALTLMSQRAGARISVVMPTTDYPTAQCASEVAAAAAYLHEWIAASQLHARAASVMLELIEQPAACA